MAILARPGEDCKAEVGPFRRCMQPGDCFPSRRRFKQDSHSNISELSEDSRSGRLIDLEKGKGDTYLIYSTLERICGVGQSRLFPGIVYTLVEYAQRAWILEVKTLDWLRDSLYPFIF